MPDADDIILGFGKYKGRTLGEIADADVLYLDWLRDQQIRDPRLRAAINDLCDRRSHEIETLLADRD